MLDNLRMTCANQVLDCYDAGKGGASAAYPPTLAPAASNLAVGMLGDMHPSNTPDY